LPHNVEDRITQRYKVAKVFNEQLKGDELSDSTRTDILRTNHLRGTDMPDEIEISGPYERAFDVLDDEHRAASLMVKSVLAGRLTDHIEEQGYTQTQAAEAFGIDQPRVSLLMNGRMSTFTIDDLINMCEEAGVNWDINREEAYTGSSES
jgi:predicted XRE-type DNA-binding protein